MRKERVFFLRRGEEVGDERGGGWWTGLRVRLKGWRRGEGGQSETGSGEVAGCSTLSDRLLDAVNER